MEELLPGIHHWTAYYDSIGERVHSYYVQAAGALIDPMVPEEGMDAFAGLPTPQQVILTNRLHFRHSARFRDAFGCVVRASEPGMHHLAPRGVERFGFGDEVAPGITALEIGVLCPDETALLIADGGAIAIADSIMHPRGGPLGFVSDPLLGEDPAAIKRGLRERFRDLLTRDFDALLFAHGEPIPRNGKTALREFVAELEALGA
jgi:hypothetical protein